jgi:hypothetical protein
MIPIIQITITFNHHIIIFIETYLIIQKSIDLEKICSPNLTPNFYKGHNSQNGNALENLCNSFFALSHTSHLFWECV